MSYFFYIQIRQFTYEGCGVVVLVLLERTEGLKKDVAGEYTCKVAGNLGLVRLIEIHRLARCQFNYLSLNHSPC